MGTTSLNRQIQLIMETGGKDPALAALLLRLTDLQSQINAIREEITNARIDANSQTDSEGNTTAGISAPSLARLTNKSGAGRNNGEVVIQHAAHAESFAVTSAANNEAIIGCVYSDSPDGVADAIDDDAAGLICVGGKCSCLVNADVGAISIGDPLVSHTVAGYAKKGADWYAVGVFAIALEAKASGTGTIQVIVIADQRRIIWTRSGTTISQATSGDEIEIDGNHNIEKVDPESRLTDTGNSEYARKTKSDTNNALIQYNRAGKPAGASNALEFPGVDEYVTCGSGFFNSLTEGSISMWLQINSSTADLDWFLFKSDGNTNRLGLGIASGKKVRFSIINGATSVEIYSNAGLSNDTWYHVAVAFEKDAASGFKMWINNVLQDDVDTLTTTGPTAGDFRLADAFWNAWGYRYFPGRLDEVAAYNIALEQADITALYNSGEGYRHSGNETGLVSVWHFDETTGTNAEDSKGNNDGTLENFPGEDAQWVTGICPGIPSVVEIEVYRSEDGHSSDEEGIQGFGDPDGRTVLRGKTIRLEIGGIEIGDIDASGNVQLDGNLNVDGIISEGGNGLLESARRYALLVSGG